MIFLIAIAESSLVLNSIPAYNPSVASRTQTKSSLIGAFPIVLMGLTFANSSNFCLMLTATLLGADGRGNVVVGPLKHASESSKICQTSSDTYVIPPAFFHHSDPASQSTRSIPEPHSRSTVIIASTSSGPVPSPLIIAALLVNPNKSIIIIYIHFEYRLILPTKLSVKGGD